MNKLKTIMERFKRYMRRTLLNKLIAILLIAIGFISIKVDSSDATFGVFSIIAGIALFIAKDNVFIYEIED